MPKQQVRNESDIFLNEVGGSSAFTPVPINVTPESLRQEEDSALTGAADPILPMKIAIADAKGKRLEFTMLINPNNLNHGKTSSANPLYTRKGWVTQLWGPNQDVLTATGKTAAFMRASVGVTNFYRKESFAYLNFMSLVTAFKNNGYRIFDFTDAREVTRIANSRVIDLIHGVEIFYDNNTYMGHFNTFTLDEDADNPFIFNYNFEFINSILNNDYSEVRGHFSPIPEREQENAGYISFDKVSLLNDVFSKGPSKPVVRSKPRNEESTYELWRKKTGLDWSEAIELGWTSGTSLDNRRLRGLLLSGEVNKNNVQAGPQE